MTWLRELASDEAFWGTATQVQAALLIALVIEGRLAPPAGPASEVPDDAAVAAERLLSRLGARHPDALLDLNRVAGSLGGASSPADVIARTRRAAFDHVGLDARDPELAELVTLEDRINAEAATRTHREDARLMAIGGRTAVPGLLVGLAMLLPGAPPPRGVVAAALAIWFVSVVLSLAVLAWPVRSMVHIGRR